ncbi:MAG: hypothetical protein ACPLKQ_04265 [Candidatus Bathyarchaeales archaeon]
MAWSKTYGGKYDDVAFAMVRTSDGGFALAGFTCSYGAEDGAGWLVKTDKYGNLEWNRVYGKNAVFGSLIQTSDGGYAILGICCGKVWFLRTDAYGNMLWNRTYGVFGNARALVETSDGGFVIAGTLYYTNFSYARSDFWLFKTDAYGNVEWNRTYGGSGFNDARALVKTSDGGYAIAGYTDSFSRLFDIWFVKTDAYGAMLWNRTYGEQERLEEAYALIETCDGGFALAGYTCASGDIMGGDFLLVKTDAYGNMEWNQIYKGKDDNCAYTLIETSDGGFALAGGSSWLVKTDAHGEMEWNRTYGNAEYRALVETSDGGFVIAGTTHGVGAGGLDFWLVKTEPIISPLAVSIVSPENKTYITNNVPLTFTVNKPAKWLAYSLDGKANVTIMGNTTLGGLSNGSHNITVYAKDIAGNTAASPTVHFTINAPEPIPTLIFAIATIASITITGTAAGLLYQKKRLKSHKPQEKPLSNIRLSAVELRLKTT